MDVIDENTPTLAGLSKSEVADRVARGEENKADIGTDKTTREIILSNLCTYFNLIFLVIGQRLEKLFQTMYSMRGRYIRKLTKNTLKKRGKRYVEEL